MFKTTSVFTQTAVTTVSATWTPPRLDGLQSRPGCGVLEHKQATGSPAFWLVPPFPRPYNITVLPSLLCRRTGVGGEGLRGRDVDLQRQLEPLLQGAHKVVNLHGRNDLKDLNIARMESERQAICSRIAWDLWQSLLEQHTDDPSRVFTCGLFIMCKSPNALQITIRQQTYLCYSYLTYPARSSTWVQFCAGTTSVMIVHISRLVWRSSDEMHTDQSHCSAAYLKLFTNNNIVYTETGTMPIAFRAKQAALKYYAKVRYQGAKHPLFSHIKATGDHPLTGSHRITIDNKGTKKKSIKCKKWTGEMIRLSQELGLQYPTSEVAVNYLPWTNPIENVTFYITELPKSKKDMTDPKVSCVSGHKLSITWYIWIMLHALTSLCGDAPWGTDHTGS